MIKRVSFCYILFAASHPAISQEINATQKNFSIELGESRVIFNENSKLASLTVINPQSYPVLIQTSSINEDKKNTGSYVITPTLLRLESNQRSKLTVRIINPKGMPYDRESMEWICVKAIPPKDNEDDSSSQSSLKVQVQLSLNTCNKIFYRPKSISVATDKFYSNLGWKKDGDNLTAVNNSPLYINFHEVRLNNLPIAGFEYIPPYSERTVKISSSDKGEIQWAVINDTGGTSTTFKKVL